MTDPPPHRPRRLPPPPSPCLLLFLGGIFFFFLLLCFQALPSLLLLPSSSRLLLAAHLSFPPPCTPSVSPHTRLVFFFFCEQLSVYFMSASSSILTGRLLGGFAPLPRILFVPPFAVSIKGEIEISCANTSKRARTHRRQSAHTRRLTKQRRAEAYERAQNLLSYFCFTFLASLRSTHSLTLCPRLHLSLPPL